MKSCSSGEFGPLVDEEMKFLVEDEIGPAVALRDRRVDLLKKRLEPAKMRRADVRCRQLAGKPLEGATHTVELHEFGHGQQRNDDRPVRLHLEKPLGHEALQRLAHRRGRDPVGFRHGADDERLAGAEAAGYEPALQRGVRLIVQRGMLDLAHAVPPPLSAGRILFNEEMRRSARSTCMLIYDASNFNCADRFARYNAAVIGRAAGRNRSAVPMPRRHDL